MKKRKRAPAPYFKVPPPFNPLTGQYSPLAFVPEKTHLALLKVLSIQDDYLTCKGFLPDTGKFYKSVNVAKPHALQKTPWDTKTVTFDGYTNTYAYTSTIQRTVTVNSGDQYEETVNQPYYVGDLLVCAKPMTHIGETPGVPTETEDTVDDIIDIFRDAEDKPISWMDMNVAGRTWSKAAQVITGTLSAAWTSGVTTDTDGSVTDTLEGPTVTGTVRVYNVFDWDADNSALFWARWNQVSKHWEVYQIKCPA